MGSLTKAIKMIMENPALFNVFLLLVDIRDVVQVHIQAARIPEASF
jgi:hypothetical protein